MKRRVIRNTILIYSDGRAKGLTAHNTKKKKRQRKKIRENAYYKTFGKYV